MTNQPKKRSFFKRIADFSSRSETDRFNAQKFAAINRQIKQTSTEENRPVLVFNASTRLTRTSLNAAFAWLTAAGLRVQGIPTPFLVCRAGLQPCLLGTDKADITAALPCRDCIRLSDQMYRGMETIPLRYQEDPVVFNEVEGLESEALMDYSYQDVPLGELTTPSVRWIMRRHHLSGDETALKLQRLYILSAWSVYRQAKSWIETNQPRAIVVFNGLQYPEATVRWIGKSMGIPTFTHEIGLMPETAFFTEGEATATPILLPDDFRMNEERNNRLDQYLNDRMQGQFKTAGVQFWPDMMGLTPDFWVLARSFRQIVPVFTNVVFDTSQKHANMLFESMFEWLDEVKKLAEQNSDTFFVIRAHPDEIRPGKESLETVADWVKTSQVTHLPNVLFIAPDQFFSSYDLIRISKFVMIYNSTIGLEAAAMGRPVLSAGKSRFTPYPISYFPDSKAAYLQLAQELLTSVEWNTPAEFKENARRFMYYQFFHTALDFSAYISPDPVWNGYVRLKDFQATDLTPEKNETMKILTEGILNGSPFVLPARES